MMPRVIQTRRDLRDVACAAAFALLIASAAPVAQQGADTRPRALVPVAASTLAANPDAYYGEYVTVTAAVEEKLSATVFSVDQDMTKATGRAVLILSPPLNGPMALNSYVTVIGEVVHNDPAEIARTSRDAKLDLAPDVAARYRGRPVVVATAVITTAGVDLTKRLILPMTADDEALSKVMTRIGPSFAALRQGLERSNADQATQQTAVLAQAFTEAEAFWKARGKADATEWAANARKQVASIERAVAAANWNDTKAPAASLGQACATCHGAYRERMEDGTFRIKSGR